MSLENIINNENKIGFLARLRNRITPYILSFSILAGAYFSDLPKSFAQEKTKTEKENKKLKFPKWLDLYADVGYVYGENYRSETETVFGDLDIKGNNICDLSLGASTLSRFKNFPIFFNLNFSNLFDGFKKSYEKTEIKYTPIIIIKNWNESYPFISCAIGSIKGSSNYIFNTSFSYSTNINYKDRNILRNYAVSSAISKLYKNFAITPAIGFIRKNSNHKGLYGDIKIKEKIIGLELNISHSFKYITSYISYYNEIYKTQSIKHQSIRQLYLDTILNDKKNGIIIKSGIYFSTSNILDLFKSVNGGIFHQSDIIEEGVPLI